MVDDLHKRRVLVVLESISIQVVVALMIICYICKRRQRVGLNLANRRHSRYSLISRIPSQISHLGDIINASDQDCINNLRLNRNAFGRLCMLVEQFGGLKGTQSVTIAEQVAMFLSILAHHKKNRIIKHDFKRSGRTVSKYFNDVLLAILRLYSILVVSPEPIGSDSTDERWKWFKGCLGALDGTYIPVKVSEIEKARYRSRKGQICVNVLGVCDKNMNFIYVLTGWEGSAADGRVLRDAVTRPNGLRVPRGNYYLCDGGYTNGEGFLAPYRGVRYHLQEWGGGTLRPQNARELFNLRHSKARNIIERAFGLLKTRWAILRSQSFYPISTQNRIIMACCLLHNFVRREMPFDPLEPLASLEEEDATTVPSEFVENVEPSQLWSNFRDELAHDMYNDWRGTHM